MTTPPFQPLPCDDGAGGSGPGLDVEQNMLCDYDAEGNVVGSALAVYEYDAETGNPTGPPTFVDPATGDPYVPLGTLRPCGTTPGVAQVYAACEDVPRAAIVTGPNLIDNGDFADSEGIGATSTAGPGFTTAYTFPSPCDDIFTSCGGAGSMAYFNTNAGQVAGSGGYPSANSIQALTTKSLAVNVGPDTTQPIICWQVALVSGREYELSADVAIINEPYSVKMTIDGVDVLPLTAPASTGQWQRRSDRFVWSGSTGLHTLCLASNSGVAAGNDHAFDNFSLREVTASQDAVLSDCEYDSRVRACIEHVVQIVGCNDDRRDAILANIAAAAGGGPANSVVVDRICVGGETWARVTLYETGAGSVVDTRYFGPDGVLESAPATFTQGDCGAGCRDASPLLLCDITVSESETIFDPQNVAGADGWELVAHVPAAPGGLPPDTPPVSPAATGVNQFGQPSLGARADLISTNAAVAWPGYDSAVGRWILRKTFTAPEDGTAHVTAALFRADGGGRVRINGIDIGIYSQWGQPGTSGTFTAPVTAGPNVMEIEVRDDWGPNWVTGRLDVATTRSTQFLRRNVYDCATGAVVDTIDTTLDGLPYTVTGEVGECVPIAECCPQTPGQAVVLRELCDDNGGVATRFLRAYVYPDGSSSPITSDTDLDGVTPYTPTGVVGACGCVSSVQVLRLCDLDPTVEPDDEGRRCARPFLRHLHYDCSGELAATRDTTMDGVTPYTPVEVVDCECGAGGSVPSLVELVWPQTDVVADPDGVADHDFIYLLTNPQTGEIAQVRLNTVTAPTAGTCGAWTPGNNVSVNAPAGNPSGNSRFTFTLDAAAQQMSSFRLDFIDLDTFEAVRVLTPPPDRVVFSAGAGTWVPGSGNIFATVANSTAHAYWDNPPATITHLYANNGGGIACHAAALQGVTLIPGECCSGAADTPLRLGTVCYDDGAGGTRTAAVVRCAGCGDAAVTYLDVETGAEVAAPAIVPCPSEAAGGADVETWPLCVIDNASGNILQHIRAEQVYDADGNAAGFPRLVDAVTGGPVPVPGGAHIGVCPQNAEPCRDSSSTLLCDISALETITVFDPANRPGSDGWEVVSFTGANADAPPEGALPYDAPHPPGARMGARSDLSAGTGGASWAGYDTAPVRWVLRKTFTAPEDGVASVTSVGFRGDGGARVRVNGTDAEMYGQWNQPATSGTAQIPVTAGPNVVEIEVRDVAGPNWVEGRLDIVLTRTEQFMRRTVVDCETGATVSVVDTTLSGEPYEVTGEVGQCQPVADCCEQPPPETRLDVETAVLCVRDTATGDIVAQVIAERVFDDQTGVPAGQRLTTLSGGEYELPDGAELVVCQPEPAQPCQQVQTIELCDRLPEDTRVRFLRAITRDCDGAVTSVTDTELDAVTPYTVAGEIGDCSCPSHLLTGCRCDDADGDGVGEVDYVELISVDGCTGTLTSLGTYLPDLSGPYTPVSPVECPVEGAPPGPVQVSTGLERVTDTTTRDLSAGYPLLQSVTLTVITGVVDVATSAGSGAVPAGVSLSWSITDEDDLAVTGWSCTGQAGSDYLLTWTYKA